MGFLVNEKQFINDNIFKYEERMNSQYSQFLDKAPTYVSYYHISNIESITDTGLLNVEQILGPNSPLKYKQINDFPIYGVEQVLLDLNDEEEGLNTSFEGEAIILPNTVKPLPNDFFTISYMDSNYLFMVTQISYDTIKSNNYYKINFTIKSLDGDGVSKLASQTTEKFTCIVENIGTQEKCIIRNDDLSLILKLNTIYKNIVNRYKMLFFNKKYNNFIFVTEDIKIYDKYLSHFMNTNKILNEKYDYETVFLTNEDPTNTFLYEYETSLFRNIETLNKSKLKHVDYSQRLISNPQSCFRFYRDNAVRSVSFLNGTIPYISHELIDRIKSKEVLQTDGIVNKILIDYFNKSTTSIASLDLTALEDYDYIDYSFESFVLIPVILYILRYYYSIFMAIK